MKDRTFISESNHQMVQQMKDKGILGFDLAENMEVFSIASAMGVNNGSPLVKQKFGWFLINKNTFKTNDEALYAALVFGSAKTDEELDSLANRDEIFQKAEEYAEGGFKKIAEYLEDSKWDGEVLEQLLLKELDGIYLRNVENDI